MPDCPRCDSNREETAKHAFYYGEWVRLFWNHIVDGPLLVLLDVGYAVDNVLPQFQGGKRVVFLAVARMVIWMMGKKGIYDGANYSHRDLILFFRHQRRIKIRCDSKRFRTAPRQVGTFCPLISLVSSMLWVIVPIILVVRLQDLPHPHSLSYPIPLSSPSFLKILDFHYYIFITVTHISLLYRALPGVSFVPLV